MPRRLVISGSSDARKVSRRSIVLRAIASSMTLPQMLSHYSAEEAYA